ncbi:glycosyltransferase [Bacillus sp. CGMCC 1.16607]|uniref:glycosyltransferase n=1 Tax=Bacillus sp. CGMCC 1.16607 TaxID=3351842 RepID=UPI003637CB22
MSEIKISAIMPVFNGEKYIRDSLLSLLQQTYLLHEIIVIDDNSSDQTVKIVKEIMKAFKKRIKIIKLSENVGASKARNIGLNIAEGEWVLFLDADDIVLPNLLEEEICTLHTMQMEMGDSLVLVYPSYEQIDENGNSLGVMRSKQVMPEEVFGYELIRNDLISPSGVLVSKEKLKQIDGFNEELRYSEDWDLWLRLSEQNGFAYLDKPLVKIRRHENNASSNINRMLNAESFILNQYGIDTIKEALYKRNLSFVQNTIDFISMLIRLNYWEEVSKYIILIKDRQDCPNNIYFYQGIYYLQKKEINVALRMFERILEYDSQHGSALNNLGCIHLLNGSLDNATFYLNKAINFFPGYIDASHNLELCQIKKTIKYSDVRFTWRELRKTLLRYRQ